MFADDAKNFKVVRSHNDYKALQKWFKCTLNLVYYLATKVKHFEMPTDHAIIMGYTFKWNTNWTTSQYKDLGILFESNDDHLKFHDHVSIVSAIAIGLTELCSKFCSLCYSEFSQKIPHYARDYSFYTPHCYYYTIKLYQ